MIELKNGKIIPELLDNTGALNKNTIDYYSYNECKINFEEIVDILETNKLIHATLIEDLEYTITEDLNFKIKDDNYPNEYSIIKVFNNQIVRVVNFDTEVYTLDRKDYESSVTLCMLLLRKVKQSFDQLNEVEKYIIKSLEFDMPHLSDEEIIYRLIYYNKNYYQAKKSAFIKLGLQLNIYDKNICLFLKKKIKLSDLM